ncbi:MAG: S1C family serine protease [Planctomycetota bacterium]|jgi:hypothetical protein
MPRHIPPAVSLLVLGAVLVGGAFQWGLATAASNGAERRRTAVVDAVAHASPSVVSVDAWTSGYRGRGSGAGAIIHPDGYVVTNSHVIHGAQRITVQLFGQRSRHNARLVRDEPGGDLALLKIDGNRRWPYISLASTREVMLGETAIAVGNPHGLGDTITVGVVSARGRPAKLMNGATLRNLIQTDASINTGNSGTLRSFRVPRASPSPSRRTTCVRCWDARSGRTPRRRTAYRRRTCRPGRCPLRTRRASRRYPHGRRRPRPASRRRRRACGTCRRRRPPNRYRSPNRSAPRTSD